MNFLDEAIRSRHKLDGTGLPLRRQSPSSPTPAQMASHVMNNFAESFFTELLKGESAVLPTISSFIAPYCTLGTFSPERLLAFISREWILL
jgi:hypothetical protein